MVGSGYAPPRSVYGDLDTAVRTDLQYHYAGPVCAQRWLDVCDDPGYGHASLLGRVDDAAPRLARALRDDADGAGSLHLTSLGPGDGAVDERLLRGCGEALRVASYTGLDSSFELLRRSVSRLAAAEGLPPDMAVSAVCGDFTALASLGAPVGGSGDLRVFSLLGFTLGNYPEGALVERIGGLMHPGDYLLVDARLHDLGPLPEDPSGMAGEGRVLGAGYDLESVRRFVFGPVEVATLASADEVAIGLEASRALTQVPNALNLVLHCTDLDTRMRLTGERVRRRRLDLAVTTSYHLPDLRAWIGASGLTPVWDDAEGGVAFFLLRK